MTELVTAPSSLPFVVALVVMLAIGLLEGVGTLLGMSLSVLFDNMLPEIDVDVDLDSPDVSVGGPEPHAASGFTTLLGWLRVGQVPVLILLIVFLTVFGLLGLMLQSLMVQALGGPLPAAVASLPVFFATLPIVRVCGGIFARLLPKDETEAVSESSFVGRVATITLGTATREQPAQAKLRDQHGQTHYVLVEPDGDEMFEPGCSVVLVRKAGAGFRAIRNTYAALLE